MVVPPLPFPTLRSHAAEQWTQDRLGIRARYETDVTETLRQDV